jgi:RNA polymerase sigma factor (sigma-70 family)
MDDERWAAWVRGFRTGDPDVEREFWDRYGPLLQRVAAGRMADRLRRRVEPEDVVQSACRTFFRRARAGQVVLTDSESLWRLLCAIVITKVREQARFHTRERRSLDREVPLAGGPDDSGGEIPVPGREPPPDEAVAFVDYLEQLLVTLDDEERGVIDLKLQGLTHDEVANRLGLTERTARRVYKRVRTKLARALGVDE